QVRRDPGTQQQDKCILVLVYKAGVLRPCLAGDFNGGLRLEQVERGGDSDGVAPLGKVEAILVGAPGVVCELKMRMVGL
ncbi:hypothetical protein ACV334_32580, partial [Pseudomonas aeruginosa]